MNTNDGFIYINVGSYPTSTSLEVQDDGKIIITRIILNQSNSISLTRLNSDGSLDLTFGVNGEVIKTGLAKPGNTAIQVDGKILNAYSYQNDGFWVARRNVDGSLDTTFSGDGHQTIYFDGRQPNWLPFDQVHDLLIQKDGRIVVVGEKSDYGSGPIDIHFQYGIVRLNADGSIDKTFGYNGKETFDVTRDLHDIATAVAIQSSGKIIVGGYGGGQSPVDFSIMRLNSDGSLDKSFTGGGIHTVSLGQNALLIDLVVQSDDKIIALIQQGYGTGTFVVRLNPDGGFDTSFNATNVAPILTPPTHINYIDTALDDSFALITGLLVAKDNSKITYNIIGGQENNDGTVSKECDYGFLTVNKTSGAYSFNPSDPNIEALLLDVSISFTITASDGLLMDSKPLIVDIVQYGKTESLGNDRLLGTSGDDLINGLAGADIMKGGFGNDIYIVDNYHDSAVENKNSGIDTVITSLSTFSLKKLSNIENITYSGDSNTTLLGNNLENILIGGIGNDTLNGGLGNDYLAGGAGFDHFVFNTKMNAQIDNDTITDFVSGSDKLDFGKTVFKALGSVGTLNSAAFNVGDYTSGQVTTDRIIYNPVTGALYYDSDGSGNGASIQIAILGINSHPSIAYTDIQIIV